MAEKAILFNAEMVRSILNGKKTATRRLVNFHKGKNPSWSGYVKDGLVLYNGKNEPCSSPAKYKVGDTLYVRETWRVINGYPATEGFDVVFYADGKIVPCFFDTIERYSKFCPYEEKEGWQPSIYMPKEAARIFLRVTDVRLERLQTITEEQAEREGVLRLFDDMPPGEYEQWARNAREKRKQGEWGFKNYLWHGCFRGVNLRSEAWDYQWSEYDSARDSFSSLWNRTVPINKWGLYGWNANPWVWVYEFERM